MWNLWWGISPPPHTLWGHGRAHAVSLHSGVSAPPELWRDGTTERSGGVHRRQLTHTERAHEEEEEEEEEISLSCQRANKTLKPLNRDSAYCTLLYLDPSRAFIWRLRGLVEKKKRREECSLVEAPPLIQQKTNSCEEAEGRGTGDKWRSHFHVFFM